MQNTEILQPSFWAMRLKKCEGSHKQSVEEFTNKHKHPGSQSNTSATPQVPCPQLNGSCGSTVAPPYLLCRHWCPGRRLTCSSLIWLDPYRSSNCLRLQLVTQTLHEELRNDRVWFPSRPACCGKLRRSIWTQKRRNVFQTFRLKVWFFANAPEGSPSCLSLKRTPPAREPMSRLLPHCSENCRVIPLYWRIFHIFTKGCASSEMNMTLHKKTKVQILTTNNIDKTTKSIEMSFPYTFLHPLSLWGFWKFLDYSGDAYPYKSSLIQFFADLVVI